MALTFPRNMPTAGVADQKLEPMRLDFMAPELGGHVGAVSGAFPLWQLDLTLGDMGQAEAAAWRAFLRSLRGSQRTFYARDLIREYPRAYPTGFGGLSRAGGGAFPASGAPTAWALNDDRDVLTLTGMPNGFQLSEDDLVGWSWGGDRRTMAAAVENVACGGSGVLVVTIDPPLPPFVPADAAVTLYRAEVVMRVVTGAGDSSGSGSGSSGGGSQVGADDGISTSGGRILAIQDLRP